MGGGIGINKIGSLVYRSEEFVRKVFYKILRESVIKSSFGSCGKNVHIAEKSDIKGIGNISIGDDVAIGPHALLWTTRANIIIKEKVIIGPGLSIITGDHKINVVGKYMADVTDLFDSYYVLPERPDLAALFCWQAINHSYYVQQLSDNNVGFCQDTKGIELIRDAILGDWNNKYKAILEPFLKRMPDKTFHYVTSYMLKGYAMEKKGIAEKYRASSYKTLKRKIPSLLDILDNAYGKSYCQISNPTLVNNEVDLGITNANKGKSRAITHSFGTKLKALMLGEEVEITFCDVQGTKKTYKFTEVERMSFVLFGILYASRCNNFHGNVAARMNSINANKDTFKMYTDMFLTEYIILAIHLNSQGALSDVVLNKVKKNANLMI